MSSVTALAKRLRSRSPVVSAWCGLPDPFVAGILAREAFDAVTLDMQHGMVDIAAAIGAVPAIAAAGKAAMVRIAVGDFATASRLLDAGAAAIIAPMINTIEDARRFAASMKYPPVGERSWGPHGAVALTGLEGPDYFAQANDFSLSFAMVETREALAMVDEILAVQGIDGIFVGPSDLSIALSGGRSVDPSSTAVDEALIHAQARARAAGKFIGVYTVAGEHAADYLKRGFDVVALGSDGLFLRAGAQAALKAARG